MEKVIKVLENDAIDVNGVVLVCGEFEYYKYYSMFIKKGIAFKIGATIVQKKQGRPRTSNRVQKTFRIDKKHIEDVDAIVKGLNMSDKILAMVNDGDTNLTINDMSIGLIKFWTKYIDERYN